MRDRCTPIIDKIKSASATKSRSDTASMLLADDEANPRSRAVAAGSKANPDPAKAPDPSGLTLVRINQSWIRSKSREKD